MLRERLWTAARSILLGWAILVPIAFLLDRLLLLPLSRLGPNWFPTVRLTLNCLALAASGWGIGRLHRSRPVLAVLAFAATLTFRDFNPLLAINVPWLIQLAADAFRDPLYWSSLAATAAQHILLFGSLIVGAVLSRPSQPPVSIFGENPR